MTRHNTNKYSSPREGLNKIWYIYPMESYAAIKMNKTISTNSQMEKSVYSMLINGGRTIIEETSET